MRIVHLADTHLGYRQYNLDERENDLYDVFDKAIDKAVEERADVLIHSGDLFDSPRPPIKALYRFKNAMEKIKGKMRVYTVLGDHETPKRRGMIPHRLFDIRVLGIGKLEWEEVDGVLIAGISNLKGRGTELLKEEIRKFDAIAKNYKSSILVAHQAIDKYLPFEGAYELKEDELPKNATYYAFGHIHSRALKKFGGGYFAYAGSTEIFRKSEISSWRRDGKGFYLVDLEGDEVEVHKIDLDIRPQFEVEVEEGKIDEVLEYIDYPKPPILHITVKGTDINRQYVIEKLNELLQGRVLRFNPSFKDLSQPQLGELPKGSLNLESVIHEYLKDESLSKLAINLYKSLSKDDIEEAKKLAEEFLESEYIDHKKN